ncbi:MAG: MerC domain-containing protein [Pseudomonadota bacterium]
MDRNDTFDETTMIDVRMDTTRTVADWLGMAASTACVVHCLLLPALMVTGAMLPAAFHSDEHFHHIMLWIVVPTALVAFGIGWWRHRDLRVLALGCIGLAGIVMAGTMLHDALGENGERVVTLLSASLLIAAHYRNFSICRTSDC